MRIIRRLVFALVIAAPVLSDTGFLNRSITVAGNSYRYQVYVPADYNPARQWPVIVYLHGNGGQGDDGVFPTAADLGNTIRRYRSPFPAIVLFPQAPTGQYWEQLPMQELVIAELNQVEQEFRVERSREYLTGHSMGAAGTYRIAYRWPDRFAALVSVSGTVQPIPPHLGPDRAEIDQNTNPFTATSDAFSELSGRIKHLPIWIFHGDMDDVVSVDQSRQLASALKRAGADIHYSEFHNVGHIDAATKAYADPEMLKWLLSQYRNSRTETR